MRVFAAPWALAVGLVFGCAAGKSDDVISLGPPGVGRGDDGTDRDDAMSSDDDDSEGHAGDDEEPDEPFDDAGDDATADDGAGDGAPPMDDDGAGSDGGGGDPPPPPPANDDGGGQPPPPPPPGGLDAQCQSYCSGLQQCGLIDGGQAEHSACVMQCAEPYTPACDAAWSNVITCVAQLDCFGMGLWWFYVPGYPCAAEDQAAAQACS